MGMSGFILRNKDEININKIVDEIKNASQIANLDCIIGHTKYSLTGVLKEIIISIAEKSSEEDHMIMRLYVHDMAKTQGKDFFDWIIKDGQLYKAIFFEKYPGRERILLDFLEGFLSLKQSDYFWGDMDWYYDYEVINRIKKMPYQDDWCYIQPNKLLELEKDYGKPQEAEITSYYHQEPNDRKNKHYLKNLFKP